MKKHEIGNGYYIIDLSQITLPGTGWPAKERCLSIGLVGYYSGGYRFHYFSLSEAPLLDDLDVTDNFFLKKLDLENALH